MNSATQNGRKHLVAAMISIVAIWGWALPWMTSLPSVEKRIEFLDERGIDPSAMFYTELEVMDEILDRRKPRSE